MKAIIFGGIGTIANTSYLQRKAFNAAFKQLSVKWYWSEEEYRSLLVQAGGEARISQYNKQYPGLPEGITASQVHKLKTTLFHDFMTETDLPLRSGVHWVIQQAKANNIKLAFATTTSRKNIEILLKAAKLQQITFDIISDRSLVSVSKPDPEVYQYCLKKLNVTSNNCISIEDADSGLKASVNAGIRCIAFPNEFTSKHNYDNAIERVDDLRKAECLSAFVA